MIRIEQQTELGKITVEEDTAENAAQVLATIRQGLGLTHGVFCAQEVVRGDSVVAGLRGLVDAVERCKGDRGPGSIAVISCLAWSQAVDAALQVAKSALEGVKDVRD